MTREEVENGRGDMEVDEWEGRQVNDMEIDEFNPNYLGVYYNGKHPGCDVCYFGRREFSFTVQNDIYIRYQSFNSLSELENSVKEKCPLKIDVGAVYSVDAQGLRRCVEEIVFSFTYPRLDMEVSKKMGHLLKAPFCVHPQTGCVCVPIDPNRCDEFDPTTIPTLSRLLKELNMGSLREDAENELDRTSLGDSVMFFRSSFLQPLLKSCKEEIESSYSARQQQSKNPISW